MAEPWLRAIQQSQDEVVRRGPHPHYLNAYRAQELSYWRHVPAWIWEDWASRPVNRCLDIGCAYGTLALFAKEVLGCPVYCTDWTDRATNPRLVSEHGLRFEVNNIELDPFPWDLAFDVIIFTEVLEHLNFHPLPTLKKIAGLLTGAGRLYVSTPDAREWGRASYYESYREMPLPSSKASLVDDHVCLFTADELVEVAREAGLEVHRLDYSPGVSARHLNLTFGRN